MRVCAGGSRTQLGEYLGHHDGFALAAMHAYVDAERLQGLTLDAALRVLLRSFRLPGACALQKGLFTAVRAWRRPVLPSPGCCGTSLPVRCMHAHVLQAGLLVGTSGCALGA